MAKMFLKYFLCLLLGLTFESVVFGSVANEFDLNHDDTTSESTIDVITDFKSPSTNTETESTISSTTLEAVTSAPPTVHNISTKSFTWKSSALEENPIVISVPEGYFISATVSKVDMDDGNYLLLEAGDQYDNQSKDGRVFANTVEGPVSYLFETENVYALCKMVTETSKYEFTVVFRQAGELTTTEIPTTTVSVPPTEQGDSIYIKVSVTYKSVTDKPDSFIDDFKGCVADMATSYCNQQNIKLTTKITNEYVMIDSINGCPYSWPNSDSCLEIRFKLPIFYNESSSWTGYQLNSNHLEAMWSRDADGNKCLYDKGFSVYEEPDVEKSIMWYAIGISLILLVFVVLLWFLKTYSARIRTTIKNAKRRSSDRLSIVSRKDSFSSLSPHYMEEHQDTPKLFD